MTRDEAKYWQKGKQFRLTTHTLAIQSIDGQHLPVTLGSNTVVELTREPIAGNPLLDITANGKPLLIFMQDILTRGEELTGAS